MKVLYLESPHKAYVKEMPAPILGEGHALIKIALCGVCGTEIAGFKGVSPVIKYPVEGVGHEAAGIITAIGNNDKGLKVGDRVCLEPYTSCGECFACKQGRYNNCNVLQTCGVHRPGMMATLFSHPISLIHKIPDNITWEQGAMIEPLTIGIHANHRARIKAGEHVLITGAGSIGMLAALAAKVYGAIPVIADPIQERLDFCRKIGLDNVCNNARENLLDYLPKVCGGDLPDAVIECSGAGQVVSHCADYVRNCGRIVFVGWPKQASEIETTWYIRKELDIFGSRNSNGKFPESIDLISSGKIDAAGLISTIVPMDEAPALFEKLVERPGDYLKAVVRINDM